MLHVVVFIHLDHQALGGSQETGAAPTKILIALTRRVQPYKKTPRLGLLRTGVL
jgi:hypothetical protein